MYDSVTGTEADLAWTNMERGAEIGKQYVTFNHWQAYPELVVSLRRRHRDECTQAEPEPELADDSSISSSWVKK